jgi:hypothetical protein
VTTDRTFEMLVELLLRVTRERDELQEKNRQLHQDLWQARQRAHQASLNVPTVTTFSGETNVADLSR